MTLTQMNYIITISETGSLNKAAEALYISQPSLTNAVKELEKELGITIFNRSGRGVTLTNDGTEFLMYARQIYGQYESVVEKYSEGGSYKKKFGVSTQHYSFAVKAFVDMVQKFDVSEYEFAIRETKTADVISDVSTMKSEVGVLYLSDFNRKALLKLLHSANLEFHHLIDCQAYVYLWKNHPLSFDDGDFLCSNALYKSFTQDLPIICTDNSWNRVIREKTFIKSSVLINAKFDTVASQLFINQISIGNQIFHKTPPSKWI